MNEQERQELVDTWIQLHAADRISRKYKSDPLFWAFEKLDDICRDDPDTCWRIILGILSASPSESVISNLAAGPLEDLLARHGTKVIERVEVEARRNPAFKNVLGGVWQNAMTDEVWARVQKIAGKKW